MTVAIVVGSLVFLAVRLVLGNRGRKRAQHSANVATVAGVGRLDGDPRVGRRDGGLFDRLFDTGGM